MVAPIPWQGNVPRDDADIRYQPVDALKAGITGAMVTGAAGLFMASIQNAQRPTNVGALGVFTKSGGLIFTFTIVGGTFEFAKNAAANLRQKNDHYNAAVGGFLAGAVMGLKGGRMAPILGYGAFTAVALAGWDYTGGLAGRRPEVADMDAFERRERLRLNRRRPMEETLANVGEGRGIKPPGFHERRKKRLEEKYGVEINPVSALADS